MNSIGVAFLRPLYHDCGANDVSNHSDVEAARHFTLAGSNEEKSEMGKHVSQHSWIQLPLFSMVFANIQIRKQCATQDEL